MDTIKKFITDVSIMGIVEKVIAGILVVILGWALKWGIGRVSDLIRKLINLRNDMEELKSTINKDKEQISRDKNAVKDYMEIAERYKNQAREDKQKIEQIKEAVAQDREAISKKNIAIGSLLSSEQERNIIDTISTEPSEDANIEILEDYLKS